MQRKPKENRQQQRAKDSSAESETSKQNTSTEKYSDYHDTNEWREVRDLHLRRWIIDEDAVIWLLLFADLFELFDDVADKDKDISRERAERAVFEAFIDFPANLFFARHMQTLLPVISMGIYSWCSANDMEEGPPEEHDLYRAYGLRNVYVRVVHTVVEICRGRAYLREHLKEIDDFFLSEHLDEYLGRVL